jgi:hypothetical protein
MRPTDHRRPAAARAFAVLSASSSLVTKLIVAIAIICSQCFVVTGDTVGNPAATKTGNTVTCHRAATSRREALPGAWEAGVYPTAGAEANHQSLHGRYVGTLSRKRRRHRRWLGCRDDDRLPRITGPCDRAPAARDHQLALTSERTLATSTQGRPLPTLSLLYYGWDGVVHPASR